MSAQTTSMETTLSRRLFVTGAALTSAGMVAAITSSQNIRTAHATPAANSLVDTSNEVVSGVSVFEPDPIDPARVDEVLEADVLVIGAGVAGSFAAATAAEEGRRVVVFQKDAIAISNGSGAAAWHSAIALQAMQDAADAGLGSVDELDFDPWQAVGDWFRNGNEGRSDLSLLKAWICNSGPTMDWAVPLTNDVEGVGPVMAPGTFGWTYEDPWTKCYPTVHAWMGQMQALSQWMCDYAAELGADIRYETPAVQLATDEAGAVIGAYGKTEAGNYVLCKAASTILAAGDYGNNPELRAVYMPFISGLPSAYCTKGNTGDGQLMAMAVGGKMQPGPHSGNIHYDPPVNYPDVCGSGIPWLRVNKNGERFSNEDVTYGQIYAADMNQPGYMHYQIFDDNFRTDCGDMGDGMMRKEPPIPIAEATDAAIAEGNVFKADTIEGLAEAIGVPVETFTATVERYNALCDAGYDLDFGKQARRLKPIKKAPFYAVARQAGLLCSLNGIVTNAKCEALDENLNVIPGLYCVGNCQGNFFGGLEHPMVIPGMSLGRAMTTGRIAGLYASGAGDKVLTEIPL